MLRLEVSAPDGLPEVTDGDDLAALVAGSVGLRDGDVVAITSKVVAKAEGRVRRGDREEAVEAETVRVVARRGPVRIVRTSHGLTMAAAGVDASNVTPGSIVLLPVDADESARRIRARLLELTEANVGVLVTDTAGRAWREGQTDIAVGAAGLVPLEELAGRVDGYGNQLAVTRPAVADELAGAAELALGKLSGRPVAVLRGRADLVLPPGDHGPGARALVRPDAADLFGYGAREAVVRAVVGDDADRAPFGAPATADDLGTALAQLPGRPVLRGYGDGGRGGGVVDVADSAAAALAAVLCFAHGWRVDATAATSSGVTVRVSPTGP